MNGDLGSYTWGGGGSDGPWIVGRQAGSVPVGGALGVSFTGASPASWTAAWASVTGSTPGDPAAGTSGSGDVAITAPASPGDWSLQVTARFGPGANAAYYWRITVTR